MTRPTYLPPANELDTRVESLKWLAMLTMAIDHIGLLLLSDTSLYFPARVIGRICLPLILWMMALHLANAPRRSSGYLKRLWIWAVISQPPYWMALLVPQKHEFLSTLNIFATLGLGVMVFTLIEPWERITRIQRLLHVIGIVILLAIGTRTDYGAPAVAAVAIVTILMQRSTLEAAVAASLAASIAGLLYAIKVDLPHSLAFGLGPLLAIPVIIYCVRAVPPLPRLRGWLFYAFYPFHLCLLIGAMVGIYQYLSKG